MTIEKLEQRIINLRAGKEQKIAEANLYEGAAQEAEYWLEQLKTEKEQNGSRENGS